MVLMVRTAYTSKHRTLLKPFEIIEMKIINAERCQLKRHLSYFGDNMSLASGSDGI